MSAGKTKGPSFPRLHTVVDYYRPHCLVTLAVNKFVDDPTHISRWLVSYHLSKNGGADWTLQPILLAFEAEEARFMKEMSAGEGDNILVGLYKELIFIGRWLLVFKLAYAAYIV